MNPGNFSQALSKKKCATKTASVLKGRIPYHCCPKESMMVYVGTRGRASVKCPKCGKFVEFDYDSMTSKPGEAIRGASNYFKSQE